jgi:hypothetical protein
MAIPFRSWRPTKSEADLLVDMLTARLAPAKIAKTLYIDVRTLRNFLGRLDAAMDTPCPELPLPPRPPRPAPTLRIIPAALSSDSVGLCK